MESRTIRENVRSQRKLELEQSLQAQIDSLHSEGYEVSFGYIGNRTTYALLVRGDEEVVGYTYIRGDLKFKSETVGKSKALMQAIARKNIMKDPPEKIEIPDIPEV